jgi:hypothetical protein
MRYTGKCGTCGRRFTTRRAWRPRAAHWSCGLVGAHCGHAWPVREAPPRTWYIYLAGMGLLVAAEHTRKLARRVLAPMRRRRLPEPGDVLLVSAPWGWRRCNCLGCDNTSIYTDAPWEGPVPPGMPVGRVFHVSWWRSGAVRRDS